MRFLVDMCLPLRVAAWLNEQGHDAVHAFDQGMAQAPDSELLDCAVREARVVITADTDFPQLLALSRSATPGIVLFRGGDYSTQETIEILERLLLAVPETALAEGICVADRRQIRYRRLPVE